MADMGEGGYRMLIDPAAFDGLVGEHRCRLVTRQTDGGPVVADLGEVDVTVTRDAHGLGVSFVTPVLPPGLVIPAGGSVSFRLPREWRPRLVEEL